MIIVVDGFGGDHAPHEIVKGAVAASDLGIKILLTGPSEELRKELRKYAPEERRHIELAHASRVITMEDSPLTAVKERDNSIYRGLELVKMGDGDGFVSAGNTGAVVAASVKLLRVWGITRPAIATVYPEFLGKAVVLDAGANADCLPIHLHNFAVMGRIFAEKVLNIPNPRVALLSIGEEETKGNRLIRETHKLFKKHAKELNFIGNIEGKDLFGEFSKRGKVKTKADVVVCDGFTGNVILKTSEGVANLFKNYISTHVKSSVITLLGGLFMLPVFKRMQKDLDYRSYGGAPLLGVKRPVVIAHGRSDWVAIRNAIKVAKEMVEKGVTEKIVSSLS
jgi:glycerol-3-phosphate acyltransferase PlsX